MAVLEEARRRQRWSEEVLKFCDGHGLQIERSEWDRAVL